ncbi:MAG: hypothetical protein R6U58_13270 [Bacteroidales bacterium]
MSSNSRLLSLPVTLMYSLNEHGLTGRYSTLPTGKLMLREKIVSRSDPAAMT